MELVAVCTGKIKSYIWNNKEVTSAILKKPTEGPIMVKIHGLEGDDQADQKAHGGLDKAIYALSAATIPYWKETLQRDAINYGEFGENLSLTDLDEKHIYVGDTFSAGSCILQAVQPRTPCYKLELIFNQPIIEKFNSYNRCGVYFRVIQEGLIQKGDRLNLIKSEKIKASIYELYQIYKNKGQVEKSRALELASIESMNEKWKTKFVNINTESN
jgi:MOSC domain-containing protein YiiM